VSSVEEAIALARKAHAGQTDKAGPARLAVLDEATAQRPRRKYADSTSLLDRYVSTPPGSTDGR
jgi:hypothetical protein